VTLEEIRRILDAKTPRRAKTLMEVFGDPDKGEPVIFTGASLGLNDPEASQVEALHKWLKAED
tara:strand:- start:240 stop:428 length:189 start_codon:yes stop_codon:yes gene_type:complete